METNEHARAFCKSFRLNQIEEREFYTGGRVNATRLLYEAKDDEVIKYVDFTSKFSSLYRGRETEIFFFDNATRRSVPRAMVLFIIYFFFLGLYPAMMRNKRLPLGHPKLVSENFNYEAGFYFGIMRCRVKPPVCLYVPVLPVRYDNKLYFPLCAACMTENNQLYCSHKDSERELVGSWCTPELELAVEMGYEIVEIYSVWNYDRTYLYDPTTYDPDNEKDQIYFVGYVNKFLRLKMEAQGYPNSVVTEEEKENYVREVWEKDRIKLDPSKIIKNPGLKHISKIMLNSLYGTYVQIYIYIYITYAKLLNLKIRYYFEFLGKFGQRTNMPQIKIVETREEKCAIFDNRSNTVIDAKPIDVLKEKIMVIFEKKHDFVKPNIKTNVVIAAFITMFARVELYGVLNTIVRNDGILLYYDTGAHCERIYIYI